MSLVMHRVRNEDRIWSWLHILGKLNDMSKWSQKKEVLARRISHQVSRLLKEQSWTVRFTLNDVLRRLNASEDF